MMDFDQWFDANGYSEEHREIFRIVWEASRSELDKLAGNRATQAGDILAPVGCVFVAFA